jgi:hypothetical protein
VRAGLTLMAVGCAPFAAGALVPAGGDTGLVCPFRELTGDPCCHCGCQPGSSCEGRCHCGFGFSPPGRPLISAQTYLTL